MGEGGAVNIVSDYKIKTIAESFVIGAEIVGVPAVSITHARNVLDGNSVTCQRDTTTNTHIAI